MRRIAQNRLTAVGRVAARTSQICSNSRCEFGSGFGLRVAHAQRNAHGRGHADGRRAAHDHGADRVRHFFVGLAGDVGLFGRQLRLVDEAHACVRPFQCLDHVSSISSPVISQRFPVYSSLPGDRRNRTSR